MGRPALHYSPLLLNILNLARKTAAMFYQFENAIHDKLIEIIIEYKIANAHIFRQRNVYVGNWITTYEQFDIYSRADDVFHGNNSLGNGTHVLNEKYHGPYMKRI